MHDKLNKFSGKNLSVLISLIFVFTVFAAIVTAKTEQDNTLNIVQLTDVHVDSRIKSTSSRMIGDSIDLFKDAITQINNLKGNEIVIFSGDVINRPDKKDFNKFVEMANELKVPWYYAVGNHDVGISGGLSRAKIREILNDKSSCLNCNKSNVFHIQNPKSFYYACCPNRNKNFLILFLDGVISNRISANGYFPKEELDWLDKQLKNNPDKKVIIVQHFPVVEPYKSESHRVTNTDEYFKVIDKYKNLIAILSGHYHATKITNRKNVLHINTPALVEYPNAFREIKITDLNNSTKFDIKLIETNLKNIQKLSKSRLENDALKYGQPEDRNAVITLIKK